MLLVSPKTCTRRAMLFGGERYDLGESQLVTNCITFHFLPCMAQYCIPLFHLFDHSAAAGCLLSTHSLLPPSEKLNFVWVSALRKANSTFSFIQISLQLLGNHIPFAGDQSRTPGDSNRGQVAWRLLKKVPSPLKREVQRGSLLLVTFPQSTGCQEQCRHLATWWEGAGSWNPSWSLSLYRILATKGKKYPCCRSH